MTYEEGNEWIISAYDRLDLSTLTKLEDCTVNDAMCCIVALMCSVVDNLPGDRVELYQLMLKRCVEWVDLYFLMEADKKNDE